MAALVGVDVDRTIAITFIIGAALAAVAGTMYLMHYGVVSFYDGFVPGIKAFTAAVLGGIGSLPGAVVGGLLIGLIETMWSAYFSIDYKDVAAFSILVITLIFLPQGLLGRPEWRRCEMSVAARQTAPAPSRARRYRPRAEKRRRHRGDDLHPVPAADRLQDRAEHAQRARARNALSAPAHDGRADHGAKLIGSLGDRALARAPDPASGGREHPRCRREDRVRKLVHALRDGLRGRLSDPDHGFLAPGALKWVDNFGIQILIYIMLGWGLNIVVGLAGLLDLGYVAFYAVGAYSYALLAKEFGLSFWILLPLAGCLSAFWGILLGFPVLRCAATIWRSSPSRSARSSVSS